MRAHRRSLWSNAVFGIAAPVSAGALCILLSSLMLSALTFFVLKTMLFADIFTGASLASGGLLSGYICGKFRRRRGLADGLLCGGILAAALIWLALMVNGELPHLWKPLLTAISGAVGGVAGVNSKRPEWLM